MLQPDCPMPTRAYNIELLHEQGLPGPDSHGWCFGLPPGISPEQWPLDPQTGYPLVHGFTLRLPADYRCHGRDIAGMSFFSCCIEHSDGGTVTDQAIASAMTADDAPEDEDYRPFWEAARSSHPRLHRMTDILDDSFAAILLTEAELNGPPCRPPDTGAARALSSHTAPRWLEVGSGRALFDWQLGNSFDRKAEDLELYKKFGAVPEARLDWSRALKWSPRATDPNAGKAPEDASSRDKLSGYQQPHFYEGGIIKAGNYRTHSWTADHSQNHIGGTMQPIQSTPRFSPFYIEFEEYLGGYNFGTGNCQLDFLNMQLDWACG
jgi:hypothetical protein